MNPEDSPEVMKALRDVQRVLIEYLDELNKEIKNELSRVQDNNDEYWDIKWLLVDKYW